MDFPQPIEGGLLHRVGSQNCEIPVGQFLGLGVEAQGNPGQAKPKPKRKKTPSHRAKS
jgi:hypothetical protein